MREFRAVYSSYRFYGLFSLFGKHLTGRTGPIPESTQISRNRRWRLEVDTAFKLVGGRPSFRSVCDGSNIGVEL